MSFIKRMKAQDVENEILKNCQQYSYTKPVSNELAFPGIAIIEIYTKESGIGVYTAGKYSNAREFDVINNKKFIRQHINCSNHLCYKGGFDIISIIREMINKKMNYKHGSASCIGYEGSPKGRKKYRDCFNRFEYYVYIAYNDL